MTMTNINDIADLLQILQDRPEWRNTVRAMIVGEELGNLPKAFAAFANATNENFKLVHEQFGKVDQRLERLETDVAEIRTDIAELKTDVSVLKTDVSVLKTDVSVLKTDVSVLKTDVSVLKTDVSVLKTDVSVLKTDVSVLKTDVSVLKTDVSVLKTDVSVLKTDVSVLKTDVSEIKTNVAQLTRDGAQTRGGHARNEATKDAAIIAMRMGMEFVRVLTTIDLIHMANEMPNVVPPERLESFAKADLVIEGRVGDATHYNAVEISFTGQESDAERATSNARFIQQLTGCPANPMVASVRYNPSLKDRIDAGRLFWYEIPIRDLEPE